MINPKSKNLHFFYRNLIRLCQKPSHTPQGYVLFLVISLSIALSGLLVAYAILSKVHSITIKSSADSNSGFYGAEGALNIRAEQLRSIFMDYGTPTGTSPTSLSACMDTDTTNNGSGNFICQSQTFAASSGSSNGLTAYSYIVDSGNGQAIVGTVPQGESFQNLNMLEYRYSINSVAQKANAPSGQVTAMTEMAIKARLIPMFQFAAFYENDLEILPSPIMNLGGPIHTNGNLYLGADNLLSINSQVTLSEDLYNSRKNDRSTTYPNNRVRIKTPAETATPFSALLEWGTGSTTATANSMNPSLIETRWGSQIQLGIEAIALPDTSELDSTGDYSQKADLKILYTPAATSNTGNNATSPPPATVPFSITSIRRTSSGTVSSSTDLTEGELRSLRQPVLLDRTLSAVTGTYNFCTPGTAATIDSTITSDSDWDTTVKLGIVNALAVAIASQATPLAFNSSNPAFSTYAINARLLPASSPPALNTALNTTLGSIIDTVFASSLTSTQRDTLKTNLAAATPAAIAALDSRCFIAAPLQDIGRDNSAHNSPYRFYNDREGRDMRLLQINVESLTAWNKVGVYVTFNNGSVTSNNSGLGSLADQRLFATALADSGAPAGSFQNLGLAGSDSTEGGFVFHATINKTTYTSANSIDSPYGFVLVKAEQLPGLAKISNSDPTGLTFVSDQAVYIQGDYNTLNWQPASVLADSLNVLSNACLNTDFVIHKLSGQSCNTGSNPSNKMALNVSPPTIPTATNAATTINAAFLAGTDITNSTATSGYNGGLENYPRFSEQWGGILVTYRGSFVSISTPLHVSGTWTNQGYTPPGRNWDYDTRFNSAENLPPLAPRFVYLKQESFTRNYNQ